MLSQAPTKVLLRLVLVITLATPLVIAYTLTDLGPSKDY